MPSSLPTHAMPLAGPTVLTRISAPHKSHQLRHDVVLYHRRHTWWQKKMDKFYPRSFNMGVRREVYNALNGFSEMRFGEDIDFSTRIFEGGHSCRLFPEAWVWHKRRTDLKSFQASAQLGHRTHQSVKTPPRHTQTGTHPAGHIHSRLRPAHCAGRHRSHLCLSTLVGHAAALCTVCHHHLRRCHTCRTQFWRRDSCRGSFLYPTWGYGSGFWRAWWRRCVLGKGEFDAFRNNFYK